MASTPSDSLDAHEKAPETAPDTSGPATVRIDPGSAGATVPRRLFGTFVEHLGRSVYDGIHERGHETATEQGFRQDVLDLVRELGVTTVRYPGGNFVSGYRWEDGVGPAEERPTRLDPAWHSLEPNTVGLHEFAAWAEQADLELIEAVNLGTRGMQEAADLLEYANHTGGTALSDERRSNGREEPFDIRLWCLGNEMDGPWQIGHSTAQEYGRLAAETARLMRMIDPDIELVAAGSSAGDLPTFGHWEREVLTQTAGLVDHISLHFYAEELDGDTASFLAANLRLEEQIEQVVQIIDEVAAKTGSPTPGIAVDEWNVWRMQEWLTRQDEFVAGPWQHAPHLLEDTYTVTEGVVVGALLITLVRRSGRVSMANLAQLVNVIAPIRTEPGGPAWRQSTFDPFRLTAAHARGQVLPVAVDSVELGTPGGPVPDVDAVATLDEDGSVALFLVHRGLEASREVRVELPGPYAVRLAETVAAPADGDRWTTNGPDAERVRAVSLDGVSASTEGGRPDEPSRDEGSTDASSTLAGSTTVTLRLAAPSWACVVLDPA
ncbi:alpha-N-arabinofuranosidase [Ornithinimicrobium sp. Y1694]|uniref:alpha-N-arabinofuranosidase n=1 Tax=Ornithinimicrobium sp. Y1694 TaxID=3418590 RepID=UPI003CFA5BEC